jgi:hypothetical protein
MVAEEELAMLYILAALDKLSAKLLVLKLFLCSELNGILLGLGRAPGIFSLLIPIFPGRENSLTLDFSVLIGLSGCGRYCSCSEGGNPGDVFGDLGNTILAAVCAAFPCDPPNNPF